jgi:hypothetical protein
VLPEGGDGAEWFSVGNSATNTPGWRLGADKVVFQSAADTLPGGTTRDVIGTGTRPTGSMSP